MQTGIVTGQFLVERLDSADTDHDPDDVPLSGTVTFTPTAPSFRVAGEKRTILTQPMTVELDSEGFLYAYGSRDVYLRATDTTEANPTDFDWLVSFDLRYAGDKIPYDQFYFKLPMDTRVDLSEAAPVGYVKPKYIVRGEPGPEGPEGPEGSQGVQGFPGVQGNPGDPTPYIKILDDAGPNYQVGYDDGSPPFITATEADGITSKVKQLAALSASGTRFEELTADSGYSFAIVYENPTTKVWNLQYGIRDDGSVYNPGGSAAVVTTPGPDIVWPGDSLSAGAGGGGTTAPSTLQAQMAAAGKPGTVRNLGVGGEQSPDIADRYAGGTMLALPDGGVWPASGSVNVTVTSDEKAPTTSFIVQSNVGLNPCTIAGVKWTLVWDTTTSRYIATRVTAGTAIPVTRPSAIISAASRDRANDLLVMWPGRNNATQTARVLSDVATMAQHQTAAAPRFLVLGVLNGNGEGTGNGVYNAIVTLNNTEKQLYGRRFVDVRRYLIDYGLTDAGITPTSQDTTDVGNDIVPTSLRSDAIHLNAAGYTLVGKLVYGRLVELGWI